MKGLQQSDSLCRLHAVIPNLGSIILKRALKSEFIGLENPDIGIQNPDTETNEDF